VRLLGDWKDPTILVGLSCGDKAVTRAAAEHSMEKIPYMMLCSPSRFCPMTQLPPNVLRATQVTARALDLWNPGAFMLTKLSPVNNKTELDEMATGWSHTATPGHPDVIERLLSEIQRALDSEVKK
jgi:hypothetical protein